MKNGRNSANIARRVTGAKEDGQNVQQFVSDPPWVAQAGIHPYEDVGVSIGNQRRQVLRG